MNYIYFIADVFTNQIFNGAQIAVFPNADGLDERRMQLIAREINLSETVFVFHNGSEKGSRFGNENGSRELRIFSPLGEIDFAGHPIIAAAYVLSSCGDIKLTEQFTPIVFEQKSGPVSVNITGENGEPAHVQFTRRVASTVDRFAPTDEELAGFLSIKTSEIDHKKFTTRLVSCGFPYLIVPVWNYETVRKAKFNYAAWSQSIAPQTAAQEILMFSSKTPYNDSDFNARLFGPRISVNEDPPVGSAMPAFASYLCSFDHVRKGTYTFTVDRGDSNSRRSVLNIEMDNKGEEKLTLRVGGQAVMVAQGTMKVP